MANEYYPEPYWLYGYPPDYAMTHDVYYDDDYWRWVRYRKPVVGLLHIEIRSKELQAEAEAERLEAERREPTVLPIDGSTIGRRLHETSTKLVRDNGSAG